VRRKRRRRRTRLSICGIPHGGALLLTVKRVKGVYDLACEDVTQRKLADMVIPISTKVTYYVTKADSGELFVEIITYQDLPR
jgi:hypothetical protein